MNATDALKSIIKASGITQKELAEKLGVKNKSVISSRLEMKNISVNVLCQMLEHLGYELHIVPKADYEGETYVITTEHGKDEH